jgi:hypothetical protein
MKHLLIFVLMIALPVPTIRLYAQEPATVSAPASSPHRDPTIAELKLQVASLKMQLLQVQGQLLNCQAPAVFREKAAAAALVRAEREKKPDQAGTPGLDGPAGKDAPEKEPAAADK